jgi:hypothetical protein
VWVWLGWVIPVVSLWFPYQVVRDILRATCGAVRGVSVPRNLLGPWWTSWLLLAWAMQIGDRLALTDASGTAVVVTEWATAMAALLACRSGCGCSDSWSPPRMPWSTALSSRDPAAQSCPPAPSATLRRPPAPCAYSYGARRPSAATRPGPPGARRVTRSRPRRMILVCRRPPRTGTGLDRARIDRNHPRNHSTPLAPPGLRGLPTGRGPQLAGVVGFSWRSSGAFPWCGVSPWPLPYWRCGTGP